MWPEEIAKNYDLKSNLSKINHTREKLIPSFLDGVPKECRHGIKIWSAQEKKHKNPLRNVTRTMNPVRSCP